MNRLAGKYEGRADQLVLPLIGLHMGLLGSSRRLVHVLHHSKVLLLQEPLLASFSFLLDK